MARFPSTAPARVDVRAIEREVQRLWREVSERPEAVLGEGVAAPVTRICTLTLLAVASTERTALRMTDVIGHLVAQHPCRSILLRLRDDAEDRLEAFIALHCGRGAPGRAPVCCEQITVEAAGRALARVPGLIFPLLVPDLPVYVWWPEEVPYGGGPSGDVLRRLIEVADALVVDSGTLAEPVEALAGLAALARPLPRGLRDLTWGRLTPWRDLLAQTFDPEPMAAALDRVDQVHIVSSGPAGTQPVGGLLLLGWLGSRLGWEPEGPAVRTGDQVEGRCRRSGGTIHVRLAGGSGPVTSVELAAGGQDRVLVRLSRSSDEGPSARVDVRTGRGRPRVHTTGFVSFDEVGLLAREIDLAAPDLAFVDSLQWACRLALGN